MRAARPISIVLGRRYNETSFGRESKYGRGPLYKAESLLLQLYDQCPSMTSGRIQFYPHFLDRHVEVAINS
jgi:hypothetical protein